MNRERSKFLLGVMTILFILFAVWLLMRSDGARDDRGQEALSSYNAQPMAAQQVDKPIQPNVENKDPDVRNRYFALQEEFQRDQVRVEELSAQDIELSGPIDEERQRIEELKSSNASDEQLRTEVLTPLLRLRGNAIKRRNIDLDIIGLLDEQRANIDEKERLLHYVGTDFSQDEPGKQAIAKLRGQMQTSIGSCDDFLRLSDGLAEILVR